MESKGHLAGLLLKPCPICSMMKDIWPNYRFSLSSQSMKKIWIAAYSGGCLFDQLVDCRTQGFSRQEQTCLRPDQFILDKIRPDQNRQEQKPPDQTRPD